MNVEARQVNNYQVNNEITLQSSGHVVPIWQMECPVGVEGQDRHPAERGKSKVMLSNAYYHTENALTTRLNVVRHYQK